jgi:hypothetical protein
MYTIIENASGKLEVGFFGLEPMTYMKVIAHTGEEKKSASFRVKQQLNGETLEEVEELLRSCEIPVHWAGIIYGIVQHRTKMECPLQDILVMYAKHGEAEPWLEQHFFFCPDCRQAHFEEQAMLYYDE